MEASQEGHIDIVKYLLDRGEQFYIHVIVLSENSMDNPYHFLPLNCTVHTVTQ